jgi:hypothetical protein
VGAEHGHDPQRGEQAASRGEIQTAVAQPAVLTTWKYVENARVKSRAAGVPSLRTIESSCSLAAASPSRRPMAARRAASTAP